MTVSKDPAEQFPNSLQGETAFAEPQAEGLTEELLEQVAGGSEEICPAYRDRTRGQALPEPGMDESLGGFLTSGSGKESAVSGDSPASQPWAIIRKL